MVLATHVIATFETDLNAICNDKEKKREDERMGIGSHSEGLVPASSRKSFSNLLRILS